jgi:hypothetical protein
VPIGFGLVTLVLNGGWWLVRISTPAAQWGSNVFPLERGFASAGVHAQVLLAIIAILLGPASEELFFRGWLWTALRRFWTPLPVIIVTGAAWAAMHVFDDPRIAIRLIPLATMLGLTRHFCKSVVASIALHMCNNATVIGAMFSLYG